MQLQRQSSSNQILLERTQELALLCWCLICTMAKLGRGVDPLELDLLQSLPARVHEHRLPESDDSLLDSRHSTLQQQEIVLDRSVAHESTHWRDGLLRDVELGRSIALVVALADTVDLVIDGRSVVVAHLTSTRNGPLDVAGMPRADTSNLPQTLVRFARQLLGTPTSRDAVEAVALGNSNAINHLVLLEDGGNLDWLLEETVGEVDLVRYASTIDLDFHQVCLLLFQWGLADLSVGENADDGAVFLDTFELAADGLAAVLGVLLGVLCESLLFALVPILVEPPLDLVAQMLSPDSCEGAKAARGLNVADNAAENY